MNPVTPPELVEVMTPPATLRAAASLVVVQTVAVAAGIAWRNELRVPLRIALIAILATQVLFARRTLRFSPGGVFGLFSFQISLAVAGLASAAPVPLRIALVASCVVVGVLMSLSLAAFPSPDLTINRGLR